MGPPVANYTLVPNASASNTFVYRCIRDTDISTAANACSIDTNCGAFFVIVKADGGGISTTDACLMTEFDNYDGNLPATCLYTKNE